MLLTWVMPFDLSTHRDRSALLVICTTPICRVLRCLLHHKWLLQRVKALKGIHGHAARQTQARKMYELLMRTVQSQRHKTSIVRDCTSS
jgi:hypothetical protein